MSTLTYSGDKLDRARRCTDGAYLRPWHGRRAVLAEASVARPSAPLGLATGA